MTAAHKAACRDGRTATNSLTRDERGAIMLLGVFFAIFLCACLFYVVGIGQTVLYRSQMQDAADTAAMSSAIVHAKGMNLLVLINLIMALLLAVLVALRLVSTLAIVAGVVGTACTPLPYVGALCSGLANGGYEVYEQAENIYNQLKDPIANALEGLHALSVTVRSVVPAIATVRAVDIATTYYAPPVQLGIALPPRLTLPVEDDTFEVLCQHAGEFTGQIATLPLDAIPGIGEVAGSLVEEGIEALTATAPTWFCGDGNSAPPKTTTEQDKHYPTLRSSKRCETAQRNRADNAKALCETATQDAELAVPDEDTGDCQQRCDGAGPHAELRVVARKQCNPSQVGEMEEYSYQRRSFRRTVDITSGRVRLVSETDDTLERVESRGNPCAQAEDPLWNSRSSEPVCTFSDRVESQTVVKNRRPNTIRQVRTIVEVSAVLGCFRKETIVLQPSDGGGLRSGDASSESKTSESEEDTNKNPQKLEEGVRMGDSNFQIRAYILGEEFNPYAEDLMKVATRKSDDESIEDDFFRKARVVGQLSVAQAEYFYSDANPEPSLRLWRQKWTAHLRRFRIVDDSDDNGSSGNGNRNRQNNEGSDDDCGQGVLCELSQGGGHDQNLLNSLILH